MMVVKQTEVFGRNKARQMRSIKWKENVNDSVVQGMEANVNTV
jgi:hypothetical protein